MIVGNLLEDVTAQSFISLADADDYLAPEQIMAWDVALNSDREAALVRASRWLAGAYHWHPLDDLGLVRVGHVAARLAAETMGRDIYAGIDAASVVASESVGSISVSYRDGVKSDLAGLSLPWLRPMLAGLIRGNSAWLSRV